MSHTTLVTSICRAGLLSLACSLSLASSAMADDGEVVPTGEAEAIKTVVDLIRASVQAEAEKNGHAFRDAHRKQHGCVQANFEVLPGLPADLSRGLFAGAKTYPAWIRYSNGSGQAQDDHAGDGRGMAVKVLGVSGPRLIGEFDDEISSQDFLMINHPVFFVRDAIDYVSFQQATTSGNLLWWLLSPKHLFHETLIARAIQAKKMTNPLDSRYWSMTASTIGDKQMKFSAVPCGDGKFVNPSNSDNLLGENMSATLAENEACFLFQIQLRTKPDAMPVEDPTIDWREADAPFTTVAKITIPRQKPKQGEFCEALSFNPWNGLSEHRPLGGISRARKAVYQEISRLRHDFNRQKRAEPAAAPSK